MQSIIINCLWRHTLALLRRNCDHSILKAVPSLDNTAPPFLPCGRAASQHLASHDCQLTVKVPPSQAAAQGASTITAHARLWDCMRLLSGTQG